ncbi:hypothetical protein PSQ90_14775 [Devosia rhodophyticola]|uniref:Uncharacterized protein n=1 Tax=Devosia rhodophyticola TaxID=3026423 RepID=A0ABY7YVY5_9HYPH|nr:hypothetical protein [Devosia rhodophyticola]WDR05523.1 hypothetical protein PSQ90_14775 [Devosia rhodophyticola]
MTCTRGRAAVIIAIAVAGVSLATSGVSLAGSGNELYLVQDSSSALGGGESFLADQSNSTNSSIGTTLAPAMQSGFGDVAHITIDSQCALASTDCGHADLVQDSSYNSELAAMSTLTTDIDGNNATISIVGDAAASINQHGYGNQAGISANGSISTINQIGLSNQASISAIGAIGAINQIGLGNSASLNIIPEDPFGAPAKYTVNQFGFNQELGLDVLAWAGTNSSYTQFGANGSYGSPATPVAISSTKSVDVIQISY